MSKDSHDVVVSGPAAIPLYCPMCGKRHVDEGVFAEVAHSIHHCRTDVAGAGCGARWQLQAADDGMPLYYFGSAEGIGT